MVLTLRHISCKGLSGKSGNEEQAPALECCADDSLAKLSQVVPVGTADLLGLEDGSILTVKEVEPAVRALPSRACREDSVQVLDVGGRIVQSRKKLKVAPVGRTHQSLQIGQAVDLGNRVVRVGRKPGQGRPSAV